MGIKVFPWNEWVFAVIFNRAGAPSSEAVGFNPDGSAANPSAFQQQLRSDSNLMAQLSQV